MLFVVGFVVWAAFKPSQFFYIDLIAQLENLLFILQEFELILFLTWFLLMSVQ